MKEVTIQSVHGGKSPSGADMDYLNGKTGKLIGPSPTYNSSYLIWVGGNIYDVHDQHFWRSL